jgi:hypothetical protein
MMSLELLKHTRNLRCELVNKSSTLLGVVIHSFEDLQPQAHESSPSLSRQDPDWDNNSDWMDIRTDNDSIIKSFKYHDSKKKKQEKWLKKENDYIRWILERNYLETTCSFCPVILNFL